VGGWLSGLLHRLGAPTDRGRPHHLTSPAPAPASVPGARPPAGPTLDDGGGPWHPHWAGLPAVPHPPVAVTGPRPAPAAQPPPVAAGHRPRPVPLPPSGFPWTAVGRVDVPGGWGSGVLVGPRHLLTASHVLAWAPQGGTDGVGWLRFTPDAAPGHAPFGSADGVAVHVAHRVLPPTIEAHEERYDYAVCVLDRRIGDETGWLGVRAYTDAWDHAPLWALAGYRGPGAAAAVPVVVTDLRLDGHDAQSDDSQVIFHAAQVSVGLSGGPVLAQWPGDTAPSVVAVQSWSNAHRSGACGGRRLVALVGEALARHP
jgi:V8-like Glu-specific endopeptidase